jgi:ring-1,2-phenylacetyl-CoA epoxidase subunit PaaA
MTTYLPTDEEVAAFVAQGNLIESPQEMSERYRKELEHIVTVSADTELVSAPAYYFAARKSPSINTLISALAIIQDEMGHAHIAYRILEDLGIDKNDLVFKRDPRKFKYPYAFDVPLDSWVELIVANAFYDRAGITLLGDIFEHTSYGPWKRGLVKVNREENFHLRHGENWMRKLAEAGGASREMLQRAVDWMFPLTVEWFGLPDSLKKHATQMDFRLKGKTNDQLRQTWMSTVVPFCESIGVKVPAHFEPDAGGKDLDPDAPKPFLVRHPDGRSGTYVLEYPFPCHFDAEEKHWLFDSPCTWDDVMVRWKARGPMNDEFIGMIQSGFKEIQSWLSSGP